MRKKNISWMSAWVAALVFATVITLGGIMSGPYVWADTEPAAGSEPATVNEVNNTDAGTAASVSNSAPVSAPASTPVSTPASEPASVTASATAEDSTADSPASENAVETQNPEVSDVSDEAAKEQSADASGQQPSDVTGEDTEGSDDTAPSGTEKKAVLRGAANANALTAATDANASGATGNTTDDQKELKLDVKYNESTGILSWNAIDGAATYGVRVAYKRKEGGSGGSIFPVKVDSLSLNIYEKEAFAELLEFVGTAAYTFTVTANASNGDMIIDGTCGPIEMTPDMARLAHRLVKVEVYTYSYSYIQKDNEYYESIRYRGHPHGGAVLLNGKPINAVTEGGSTRYLRYGEKELRVGEKVTISYEPLDTYELQSVKINGKTVTGPQTFTIGDSDIEIDVYFRQPIVTFVNYGITVSADDPVAAASAILLSDKTRLKRWEDGYTRVISKNVSAASLDDRDADICSTDSTLKSKNIIRGMFFDLGLFKSHNMGPLEKVFKIATGSRLRIMIPEYLRKSGRTYYLIRVDKDDASIVASGTGSSLLADITESGLYLIGFTISSSSGGSGSFSDGGASGGWDLLPVEELEKEEEQPEEEQETFNVTPIVARVIAETVLTAEVTTAAMTHI